MSAIFLPEVVVKMAHETFVLLGSHALRSMPHNLSCGFASGRWRWPECTRTRHIFSFWEKFAIASEDYMFAFLLPEIVIEVAYMTAEAFRSRRPSVASIAESANCRRIGELSRP